MEYLFFKGVYAKLAWKNEPKNVIVEFLRATLTDPRSRAETTETDSSTGTGSAQTISLSPASSSNKAYAISSVTVDAIAIDKWSDYDIDLQNQNVSGTFTVDKAVVVTYKRGSTNWIYPDKANETLSSTSYPRINVLLVNSPGDRVGNYQSEIAQREHYQIDFWTKRKYVYDDGVIKHSGSSLANYFSRQIVKSFEDNIDELYPILYDVEIVSVRDATWEVANQCFHSIVELRLTGVSLGG